MTTPDVLREQRDHARDIAVLLEQENAELIRRIALVTSYHLMHFDEFTGENVCTYCGRVWPCFTYKMLTGTEVEN